MSTSRKKAAPALDRSALERIADIFRVFSDATRLALLQELKAGAKSVNELVEALDTTQANISRQLKMLHQAGLLLRERKGAQVFYSVSEPLVMDLCRLACDKLNRDAGARVKPVRFA